jgi:hypothetical protein
MNQDIERAMEDLEERKAKYCENKYKALVNKAKKQGRNPAAVGPVTIMKVSEYDAWNKF